MDGPIDMEQKGCESIRCWTDSVTLNFDHTHDLDPGFSRSNYEKPVSQEWKSWLSRNEKNVSQ